LPTAFINTIAAISSPPNGEPHPLLILWRYQILDPDSDIVTYWNHVFLLTSILALFIDPLYFFLPYVMAEKVCFSIDHHLAVVITYFRSLADLFFILHIFLKFRTAFVAPNTRVFGRGELVMDSKEIAHRYLRSDFVIDLAAALPLPRACIRFSFNGCILKFNYSVFLNSSPNISCTNLHCSSYIQQRFHFPLFSGFNYFISRNFSHKLECQDVRLESGGGWRRGSVGGAGWLAEAVRWWVEAGGGVGWSRRR
ncbi:Cyclic nucleotide-gated ion channel 18, partial [Linum perenne]